MTSASAERKSPEGIAETGINDAGFKL